MVQSVGNWIIGFLVLTNMGKDTKIKSLAVLEAKLWVKMWFLGAQIAKRGYNGNASFFTCFNKYFFPHPYFSKSWYPKEQNRIGWGLLYRRLVFIVKTDTWPLVKAPGDAWLAPVACDGGHGGKFKWRSPGWCMIFLFSKHFPHRTSSVKAVEW